MFYKRSDTHLDKAKKQSKRFVNRFIGYDAGQLRFFM